MAFGNEHFRADAPNQREFPKAFEAMKAMEATVATNDAIRSAGLSGLGVKIADTGATFGAKREPGVIAKG